MTRRQGWLIAIALLVVLVPTVGLAGCQGQPPSGAQASEPGAVPTKAPRPTRPPTTSRPGAAATATPTPTPSPARPEPEPTIGVPGSVTSAGAASISYPGKLAVRGADGMLYVAQADGAEVYPLTDGVDPSWSPNGKQIAFVRWREPWGLYTINADGSGERQLVSEKHLRAPAWSPSGDTIAALQGRLEDIPPKVITIPGWGTFIVSPGGEVWQGVLKAVNPDSGTYEGDYPADAFVQSPSWSPDGQHLTYDGDRGIHVTAMGEDPRLLTPDLVEASSMTPAWSPTGDRIAYVRWMHDHWEIWSMDTAGGDKQRLTPAGTEIGESAYNSVAPAWSPDGCYLAFLTDRTGEWQVWVMRADPTTPHAMPDKCGTCGSGQRQLLDLPVKYEFNGDRILDWTW